MKVQTVVRTRKRQGGYLHEPNSYINLKGLLGDGWVVVLSNTIGDELEYILEKNKEN